MTTALNEAAGPWSRDRNPLLRTTQRINSQIKHNYTDLYTTQLGDLSQDEALTGAHS